MSYTNSERVPHPEGPDNVTPYSLLHRWRVARMRRDVLKRQIDTYQVARETPAREKIYHHSEPEELRPKEQLANLCYYNEQVLDSESMRQKRFQRRRKYFLAGATAVSGAFLAATAYSVVTASPNAKPVRLPEQTPTKPDTVASANALAWLKNDGDLQTLFSDKKATVTAARELGFCASELVAQSQLDQKNAKRLGQSAAAGLRIRAGYELAAAQTLEKAGLPCVWPSDVATEKTFTAAIGPDMSVQVSVSRNDITGFTAAGWCDQRTREEQVLQNGSNNIAATDSIVRIIETGDNAFGTEGC